MINQDQEIVKRYGDKYSELENKYSDFLTYTDYTKELRNFKAYIKELRMIGDGQKLLSILRAAIKHSQIMRQKPIEDGGFEYEVINIIEPLYKEADKVDDIYKIAIENDVIGKNIISRDFDMLAERKTKDELEVAHKAYWSFQEGKHRMLLEYFTDISNSSKAKRGPTNETSKKMMKKGEKNKKYREEIIEIAAKIIGSVGEIDEYFTINDNAKTSLYKNPKIMNHKSHGNAKRWLSDAYEDGELIKKVRKLEKNDHGLTTG